MWLAVAWVVGGFAQAAAGVAQAGVRESGQRAAIAPRPCRRAVVEIAAAAGQSVRRRVTDRLDVVLEARASGWLVRVVPHSGAGLEMDYAGIATPPYRSVSPLLVSTDFGLRAQDAVGWTPREFRFAADEAAFASFAPVYRSIVHSAHPSSGDEAALGRLVAGSPEGTIEVRDARLVPGTADQSRAAAAVASHYAVTAHTIEQPPGGRASALGEIRGISLRVTLALDGRAVASPGVRTVAAPCTGR